MFFVAGGNIRHLLVSAMICATFAAGVYTVGKMENKTGKLAYVTERIDNFLSDNKTSIQNQSINFQTKQGLIAIGSGGFFGL
jgi:cell division protein FtsW (lipid II flippase)